MPDLDAPVRLLRNARREALCTLCIWAAALTWTVGYCYLFGYQHSPDSWVVSAGIAPVRTGDNLRLVLGLPHWVFFGIVVPWVVCSLLTLVIAQFGMSDDDLGTEASESPSSPAPVSEAGDRQPSGDANPREARDD